MADMGFEFDANSVDPAAPRGDYELLPPGDYPAQILSSEVKDTSTGGRMLKLELEIIDGPCARRKFWDQLNIVNASQKAQEIAHQQLSAIAHAVGVMQVRNSEALHFKPMLVKLVVSPSSGLNPKTGEPYPPKNAVKGYSPLPKRGGAPAARPTAPAPVRPAAAVATTPVLEPVGAAAAPAAARFPWSK